MKTLAQLIAEASAIQKQFEGKAMPPEQLKKLQDILAEAKPLQDQADAERQLKSMEEKGQELANTPPLPGTSAEKKGEDIVGYMPVGKILVQSDSYKSFSGARFQGSASINTGGLSTKFVPVTREQIESKAVTIAAGFIQAERYTEDLARVAPRVRLTMRDLVRVSRTTSNAIEYMILSVAPGQSAPVAEGALKPEANLGMSKGTAAVRTIASWLPVTEQQLADIAQMETIAGDELLADLAREEERQMLWGDGTGENLLGIFLSPGISAPYDTTGNLIDKIRKARSTIVAKGAEPTAVMIHPYDLDGIVLEKDTNDSYVYFLAQDPQSGRERIHGLLIVESAHMQKPGSTERRVLVGDFAQGATLYDREEGNIAVGFVGDQFIRNMRTIRAEERVAFAVNRPYCFCAFVSQAAA